LSLCFSCSSFFFSEAPLFTLVQTGNLLGEVEEFADPVTACVWAADGRSFTLGTLDKNRSIETYRLDKNGVCDRICTWNKKHRTQDLAGSLDGRWMVASDEHGKIHVYNASTRGLEYEIEMEHKARPTSLSISGDSRHLLVNRQDGEAQIIDLETREVVQKLLGHTGGEYVIRSTFGGANESFVISGSEDGNVLIWHKNSGAAVERLRAHEPRCNSVDWNPTDSTMIASCGDDGKIKM
jgi:WD40 repeat protein